MKPLPRHEAIQPLSRHHHHALTMALKINKTLTGEVSDETAAHLREQILLFWEPGGQAHFREEEEILLPAYSRYASIEQEEIVKMLVEHTQIRALIAAISDKDGNWKERMGELGRLLEQHVRREERIIFPMMETAMPEDVLNRLAPYFHEFHNGGACDSR